MEFLSVAWAKLQAIFDLAFAGALGALASLPFHSDVQTFAQRAFAVGSGAASAHYVTPLAVEYFSLSTARSGSVAFLVGLFGMSFAAAAVKAVRETDLSELVKGWLTNRGK